MRRIETPAPSVPGRPGTTPEDHSSVAVPPAPSASPRKSARRPRWGLWLLLLLVVAGISVFFARAAIVAQVERRVVARLAQDGIYLHYGQRTWSFTSGLALENVVLRRAARDDRPVVEISSLHIGAPLFEIMATRGLISTWRTQNATVTLHDDAGSMTFEHVTVVLVAGAGRLNLYTLQARQGTLAVDLPGQIQLPAPEAREQRNPESLRLDLSTVRDIVGLLTIQPSSQTFRVQGRWSLDLTHHAEPVWQAHLSGAGASLQWQGVPMRTVEVQGRLTQAGLDLKSHMQLPSGSAQLALSLADWEVAPLVFAGQVSDPAGAIDEIAGRYEGASQTLFVDRIAGHADLLGVARGFPSIAPHLPASIRIATFPRHEVRGFTATFAEGVIRDWQFADLQVHGPAAFSVMVGSAPLQVALLEGRASCLDKTWKIRASTGPVSWRDVQAREVGVDATLVGRRLQSRLAIALPHGAADLSVGTDDYENAALEIDGSLKDSRGRSDRLSATYQPRTAAWQIARLDGAADLLEFAGNFPSLPARLPATVSLRGAFPEVAVRDLSSRPGQPVSLGSLKLLSPADLTLALQKGRTIPIDNLTGQAAFDGRRWKLTRLTGRVGGGQASVDGVYEQGTLRDATVSASKVRLAQFRPWLDTPQDSRAVLSFDYRGSLSVSEPARITGSGQVQLENAPVVKIPLLDQTYALFSALTSPIEKKGDGSLEATFAASGGIVKVSEFVARSESARVTATGTIDLKKRVVDARARGNIRGLIGLATRPLTSALEMQVSGPLDQLRVRPLGFDNILTGTLTGTAELLPSAVKKSSRLTGDIVRNGVALPLRVFDFLTPEKESAR